MKEIIHTMKTTAIVGTDSICYTTKREAVDVEGKSVLVLMSIASEVDTRLSDNTAHLLWNNLIPLGCQKIVTWNLIPTLEEVTEEVEKENFQMLHTLLEEQPDIILIAWGAKRISQSQKAVQEQTLKILEEHREKLFQIVDREGVYTGRNYHPLYAGNYFGNRWELIPYTMPEKKEKGDIKNESNNKRKRGRAVAENGFDKFRNMLKNESSNTDSK